MTEEIDYNEILADLVKEKSKIQSEIDSLEIKKLAKTATSADLRQIAILNKELKDLGSSIKEIISAQNQDRVLVEQMTNDADILFEKETIKKLIEDYNIGFLVKENKYVYCMGLEREGSNVVNPNFDYAESSRFGRVLNKMAGSKLKLASKSNQELLADYFQEIKHDYYTTTTSFNKEKWSHEKVYNKADIVCDKFWLKPDFDNAESYDKRFDFWLECLGGGKKENIEHIEKWVAFKYVYPEKVANTPNLDIGGYPGGNGKGRLVELCKTIFTNPCVSPATQKELNDGFNASWEMAVLLYYDEPTSNELPEGKIKNATGGEDIRIEKKGIDATVADRNYSLLFLSNNPNGVVKLSGTGINGEDRRFSVLTTSKVMADEAKHLGFASNDLEAKVYVNEINNLIKNRSEVAKWLAHIIVKHDIVHMDVLPPLHGKDYHERFGDQKTAQDVAFDKVLPVFIKNGLLPYEMLKHAVVAITGYENLTDKTLKQNWKRYLEKNKIAFEFHDSNNRVYIDYHYSGQDETRVLKSIYKLANDSSTEFDLATLLKKKPGNIKNLKTFLDTLSSEQYTVVDE